MAISRGGRSRKGAEWQAQLARFEQTQTTVAELCDDEVVSVASFRESRRKLTLSATGEPHSGPDDGLNFSEGSFAAVGLVGTSPSMSPTMVAELPGGIRREIAVGDRLWLESDRSQSSASARSRFKSGGQRGCANL